MFGTTSSSTFGRPSFSRSSSTPDSGSSIATPFTSASFATATPSNSGFSFGGTASSATPSATGSTSGFSFAGPTSSATPSATGSSSGFSFGAPASSANAPPTGSSGFSFGGAPTTTPASSGFSFGGAAAPAPPTGFSFGGSTSANPASSTGLSFGTSGGVTSTAPATGFSFNSSIPPATSTSLFAGTASASNQAKPSQFGSTTGSMSNFGGFGTFGNSSAPAATGFGANTSTNSFGATPSTAMQPTYVNAFGSGLADSPIESLNAIKMAYSDLQQSRFKHMFYNIIDPNQKAMYVRPPHISERLWKQAVADNPDPENCVPTAVIGFSQLNERISSQQSHVETFNTYVEGLKNVLKEMEKSSRATNIHLEKCRHAHVELTHKLIEVMRKIEIYQCLRKPLTAEETQLQNSLYRINQVLNQPTQFKAKLNELVSLQNMQENRCLDLSNQLSSEDQEAVYNVLQKQKEGLQHLTKIVKKDLRDIEIIRKTIAKKSHLVI